MILQKIDNCFCFSYTGLNKNSFFLIVVFKSPIKILILFFCKFIIWKILSCNLTKLKKYDFPISGLCTLNNCNYDEFAKRLNNIINLSDDEYFKGLDKDKDHVMAFDKNQSAIEKIRLEIDKNLGIQ